MLDKLGVPVVSIYGDSYGTYFAQAFAVRHPERVRRRGARRRLRASRASTRGAGRSPIGDPLRVATVCARSTRLPGADPLAELRRWAARLAAHAARRRRAATRTAAATGSGSTAPRSARWPATPRFYYTIYRDLLAAAARATGAATAAPLAAARRRGPAVHRRRARSRATPRAPTPPWRATTTRRSGTPPRRSPSAGPQYAAARAGARPGDAFAPFPKDIWLRSLYIDQYVTGCLRWPAPRYPDPPVAAGRDLPDVPVLVLNGDLDVITPIGDAGRAAALFPNSTLVPCRQRRPRDRARRLPGLRRGDRARASSRTLSPGDVSCAAAASPEIHVVPEFPRRTAAAPAASPAAPATARTPRDRRAGWAAALAVGDALARWWLMYGSEGHGLRGGTFTARRLLRLHPVTFRMRGVRLASDLATSGLVRWDRRRSRVSGRLRLSGVMRGRLAIRWRLDREHAVATLAGTLGGRPIRLRMPAP